jgi:hypothetical protein
MPVYDTGTSFLFLNFILALTNIYYIQLSFSIFLPVYPRFAFKVHTGNSKFPFHALPTPVTHNRCAANYI